MRTPFSIVALPLVSALVLSTAGCTTQSATFEGYGGDQVWSAMLAAARTPDYDDWKVTQNEVFVDEAGRRLEVYRLLKRLYVTPHADPRKEEAEWRLQIVMSGDSADGAPTVDFTARQISVPAHVWHEADRYFAQVRALLGPVQQAEPALQPPESGADPAAAVVPPAESDAKPDAKIDPEAMPKG
jgi:hypothetical protein